ncbi:MAG: endonuclease/exonuclease/phosphatase family protein, partial [Pirellula sp.]
MKSLFAAVFAILLGSCPCEIRADEYRIGAWNIEWLGFPDKRGRPGKDVTQQPSELAAYIANANLDVLALEEIGVDQRSGPWTSKQLDAVVKELNDSHHQPWQYRLFAKANYPEGTEDFVVRGQHTGIAWRSDRATLASEPFSVPVGENEAYGIKFWERRATAVKLSFGQGKTDMVFVPVHLKSNRNDVHPDDKSFTQKQRHAEIKVFAEQLQTLKKHFADEDIVVLGDTNILGPEDDTSKPLLDSGFVDLNQDDSGTTAAWGEGYSSAPFDRIFVPKTQPEFRGAVQKVYRTKNGTDDEIKDFKKRLSDHYLVSCVVQIAADDD